MLDTISIVVISGAGGDGCAAARRESGVPFGGPAGGDGGRGGNVFFKATSHEQTLTRFRFHNKVEAKEGEYGRIKDQYGANADDLTIAVPIGTVLKDTGTGKAFFQFLKDGEEYCIAKGGRGGAGNLHFANAIQQFPNFALLGEPGQTRNITLELQMLGDVGLVGTPSVGKSSLINTCCATRAKTAEYHFTTLEPAIGICEMTSPPFSIVDIPGLIAGASDGKGLGNQFLRHVLKAKVFALVADMSRYEESFSQLTTVLDEIFMYIHQRFTSSMEFGEEVKSIQLIVKDLGQDTSHAKSSKHKTPVVISCIATSAHRTWTLFDKAIHILANKYDMVNDPDIAQEFLKALCDHLSKHLADRRSLSVPASMLFSNAFVVSAATHYGIKERVSHVSYLIENTELTTMMLLDTVDTEEDTHIPIKEVTESEIPFLVEEGYIEEQVAKRTKVREIWDPEICRLVFTVPRGNDQAEHWFWRVMMKQKHLERFSKIGLLAGDVLKIKSRYTGVADKYILANW